MDYTDNNGGDEGVNEQDEQPRKRIDARPRNNKYLAGTGPGTGRTAIRVGTIGRDGKERPVSSTFGTATGPLSQPWPTLKPEQAESGGGAGDAAEGGGSGSRGGNQAGGFATRPGRIDARPRNNVYMPGTGPGTGRTAIRVGTIGRDGTQRPVTSTFGTATGPLSQPWPTLKPEPQQSAQDAAAQRQSNVALAKANGTFDSIRQKFNAANSGKVMDEAGNIADKPESEKTKFDMAPDGQGGYKYVPVPPKKTPVAGPPLPVAASQGLADTIKTGTGQFGANAMDAMKMPPPLVPPVLGAAPLTVPTPAGSGLPTTPSGPSSLPAAPASPATPGSSAVPASPDAAPDSAADGSAAGGSGGAADGGADGGGEGAPDGAADGVSAGASTVTPTSSLLPGTGTIGASTKPFGSDDTLGQGPLDLTPRARGGPVRAGKPYLVGEKGPEIIVPGHSGHVVPSHVVRALPQQTREAARRERARQTTGLFLKPRAVPAAYARRR